MNITPEKIYKSPRLYVENDLTDNKEITLPASASHYLCTVLRMNDGEHVRLFNGRDGEFLGRITKPSKKNCEISLLEQIKAQSGEQNHIALIFSPIKKQRMDFLIEKAVELGATDLYPVLMNRTENRNIKEDRIKSQIIEAAEQCERLTIPTLHDLKNLEQAIQELDGVLPTYWAAERIDNSRPITHVPAPCAFIIGPEGGFDDHEISFLSAQSQVQAISLGKNILRAETAALYCLSQVKKT